jgi:5-formyltetrahydrofolate cyclo-ligase
VNEIQEQKNKLRSEYLNKRLGLSKNGISNNNKEICLKLENIFQAYSSISRIIGYSAIKNEVNINLFLEYCIKQNKEVYIPKYNYSSNKYIFVRVEDLKTDLSIGRYGILEPIKDSDILNENELVDKQTLWLVPGIVFDKNGNRVGFGKGYYDKFLTNIAGMKVGIAHSIQIYEDDFNANSHDVQMDIIVTEDNISYIKR